MSETQDNKPVEQPTPGKAEQPKAQEAKLQAPAEGAPAKPGKEKGQKPAPGSGEKQPTPGKGEKPAKGGEGKGKGAPGKGGEGKGEGKGKGKGDKGGKGAPGKGEKAAPAEKGPKKPAEPAPPARLRLKFQNEVCPKISEKFGIKNKLALPRLDKVILTVGIGKQLEGTKLNPKAKEQVLKTLSSITGQKPVTSKARKSVANFKLRAGYEVGAMVTLRGTRMWEFVDRLISLSLPRIKDFRGLSDKSFDGRGNYAFGVSEQGLFPEVNMAEVDFTHGMNIAFVFRNSDDKKSAAVLQELGMPFVRPDQDQPRKK